MMLSTSWRRTTSNTSYTFATSIRAVNTSRPTFFSSSSGTRRALCCVMTTFSPTSTRRSAVFIPMKPMPPTIRITTGSILSGGKEGRPMSSRTLHPDTTAEAYLELLKDRGIDVFLGNAGTDFASLVEAFARFETEGSRVPRPLVVPHEFVAVSMAHGYYGAGGRPAAVIVDVNVGTGNASTAVITAPRANVPILMSAGRTPITEEGLPGSRDLHIHWAQESFDQAAMLREYVKWDYELRTPVQLQAGVGPPFEAMD